MANSPARAGLAAGSSRAPARFGWRGPQGGNGAHLSASMFLETFCRQYIELGCVMGRPAAPNALLIARPAARAD
eukprot:6203067-Lingulodinium_polyedra.AAC.1